MLWLPPLQTRQVVIGCGLIPAEPINCGYPATQWGLNGSLRLLSPTIVNPNGLDDNDQQDAIATANPALWGLAPLHLSITWGHSLLMPMAQSPVLRLPLTILRIPT
jgi:hypothetical protein